MSKLNRDVVNAILDEIMDERTRQHDKWGEQNHPLVGGMDDERELRIDHYCSMEETYQDVNSGDVADDVLGMDTILLEEVYEALCESDMVKARTELVQVAAVAVMIIESIDRAEGEQ